ncbi:ATP-binding region ATPase domain protein [Emticicia oligotrophica DSM 17448]|uniref:histidine kinase n=1 Tax=Emticicia oligotrophica (strain DSM 17448 / CIP 109782 / MTCC 6937 / GPTSA100-15) TaxID=929562 RepID=A0ABN4ASB2_EMTOG|nr:ATP-binding protein [Emticicia oligotrophica]AFK04392.1 ATP-binding region ATPase domain protein [Emticicia oligotrophica DSM 17448]
MKKYICLFLFLFTTNVLTAQVQGNYLIDSLKRELNKDIHDTTKVLILHKLTSNYTFENPIQALRYGREAWYLADSIRFEKGKVFVAISSGFIMATTSDYTEALSKLSEAVNICERKKMMKELISVYLNLSLLYTTRKQSSNALEYLTKAKQVEAKTKVKDVIIPLNLAEGYIYKDLGKSQMALNSFQNALKDVSPRKEAPQLPNINFYIGDTYWDMNQQDSAIKYYHKTLTYKETYMDAQAYYGLAKAFNAKKNIDSSIFYAKKALYFPEKSFLFNTTVAASLLLANIYEKQNNLNQALFYHKLAMEQKDSLFHQEEVREIERLNYEKKERELITQRRIMAHKSDLEDAIKIYGLSGLLFFLIIFFVILYRNYKIKHKANESLQEQKEEIHTQRVKAEKALEDLKATQAQLIQSEKLASLGELTAGIAHEIQNPLNFVNNFSELSIDLVKELKEEVENCPVNAENELIISQENKNYIDEILSDLTQNQEKINQHGKRASSIVRGMLQHSRTSSGEKEWLDINTLADEYLRLSYHGLRAKDKNFNADFSTDFAEDLPKISVIPQDIGRVLLNLFNNAFYAVNQRAVETGHALSLQSSKYKPMVIVTTKKKGNFIEIGVRDNGTGMSDTTLAKIFQPFFTTKPTGEGTGLGLSLSYDIITKGHGGMIEVESVEGEGTTFTVKLPV